MEDRAGSARRSAGDVAGNFGAWAATAVVSLVYVAVSSRIFGPDAVGAYAAGVLAETLAWLAVGSGLAVGVQRLPKGSGGGEAAHLGRALIAGLVSALLLVAFAGPWADLWGSPDAATLTTAFAAVALFHPPAQVLLGILRGRDRQRAAASVVAIAGVGASIIGVVPVLISRDPVALVASNLLVVVLSVVLASTAGAWVRPSFPRRLGDGRFASSTVLLNLANYLVYNSMAWSVSRFISVSTFGLYSRTWLLADLPAQGAASSTVQALFPAMARADDEEARRTTSDALVVTAAVAGSLLAAIAALSSLIVPLVLGDQWLDAIPLLATLAVALVAMPPQWVLAAQLQARSRFRDLAASRLVGAVLSVAAVALVAASGSPVLAAVFAGLLQAVLHAVDLRSASRSGLVEVTRLGKAYAATALALAPLWLIAVAQAAELVTPEGVAALVGLCAAVAAAGTASLVLLARGEAGRVLDVNGVLPGALGATLARMRGRVR